MNLYLRADLSGQSNKTEILNDDCIHLGFPDPAKQSFGFGEFGGKDQYIEREITAASAGMKVIHNEREVGFGKIFGSETGIKCR
jgi:hypothetical protein